LSAKCAPERLTYVVGHDLSDVGEQPDVDGMRIPASSREDALNDLDAIIYVPEGDTATERLGFLLPFLGCDPKGLGIASFVSARRKLDHALNLRQQPTKGPAFHPRHARGRHV
jgi:hypothetical protein